MMNAFFRKILILILHDRYYDLYFWFFFFRKNTPFNNGKKSLLIINHVFEQDIEALEQVNHEYNFVIISAFTLRNVGTLLFPPEVESFKIFNSHELDPIKRRYEKILQRFVRKLKTQLHITAVVSPSDNFFYIRQLVPILQSNAIPFIVIDKEGTICPAYFTHFASYIRANCPLISDKILVWSERQKKFWIASGADHNKIEVAGQPRSDFWRDPKRWMGKQDLPIPGLRPQSKMILFFTYDPWAYTPDYMVEKGEMHWDTLRNETHAVLYNYGKMHPETDIVIKMHPQQLDKNEIKKTIDSLDLPNIFLSTGSIISNQLIVHADCIIGFQSTALIESMLTDKPIIYTFWGEARDRWSEDLIPFHKTEGVLVAASPADLNRMIDQCLTSPELSKAQLKARQLFVDEYFYRVDGHASERTLEAISNYLRSRE